MRNKKFIVCTKSESDTFALGMQMSKLGLSKICLNGDLGSGKTVFSKGYAKGLDIEEHITSPTFNIINQYEIDDKIFYHMDAYRIDDEEMLYDIGFYEIFDGNSFVVIEWSSKIINSIPDDSIVIDINKDEKDSNIRYFVINCNKEQLQKIGNNLE